MVTAAASAGAATTGLDRYFIPNPTTWSPVPEADDEAYAAGVNRLETAAIAPAGLTSVTASRKWEDPSTKKSLNIAFIQINRTGGGTAPLNDVMHPAAKAGALSFCTGAVAAAPASLTAVAGLPNAYLAVCPSSPAGGRVPMVVSMTKANILSFLVSTQDAMSSQDLVSIARRQYAALPSSAVAPPSTSSSGSGPVVLIVLAVVGVIVAGLVILIFVRQARKHDDGPTAVGAVAGAPPLPPAGWYGDPIHPGLHRYWTGSEWGPDPMGPPSTQPATVGPPADPNEAWAVGLPADPTVLPPPA
jgi:hypothetical protein